MKTACPKQNTSAPLPAAAEGNIQLIKCFAKSTDEPGKSRDEELGSSCSTGGKTAMKQCLDSAQDGQGQAEDAVEKEQPQGRKVCAGQSHCCLINPRITVIDENLVIGEASSLLAIYLQL